MADRDEEVAREIANQYCELPVREDAAIAIEAALILARQKGREELSRRIAALEEIFAAAIWENSKDYNAEWEGGRAPEWDELTDELEHYRQTPMDQASAVIKALEG